MFRNPDRTQQVKYVTPDKVYVVRDKAGNPTQVVQTKEMAKFFATVDGGSFTLVPWYNKAKFDKDFAGPKEVTYENYEPSFINKGEHVYRPIKRTRF